MTGMSIENLKIAIAQVNPIVGHITHNTNLINEALKQCVDAYLVVFPELVICGYPPEDLALKKSFVRECMDAAQKIITEHPQGPAFILTTPWYEDGKTYNAALFADGGKITGKIFKNNLPNYGVFDEWRVFSPGPLPDPVEFKGHKIGVVICEDIWFPEAALHLKEKGAEILISPNGSPYSATNTRSSDDPMTTSTVSSAPA